MRKGDHVPGESPATGTRGAQSKVQAAFLMQLLPYEIPPPRLFQILCDPV